MTTASIIVCTFNRHEVLGATLEALLRDPSLVDRELLVVDNASTDDTAATVAAIAATSEGIEVRYLQQPQRGKSNALNLGISEARGEFLLFTDDDVLVEPGWADALTGAFTDPHVGVVGGRTVPLWPAPPDDRLLDARMARFLGICDLGEEAKEIEPPDVVGANLAIRASTLQGWEEPFNPTLGPSGIRKTGYEEHELVARISENFDVWYVPTALAKHRVSPERMKWSYMRSIHYQYGFGNARERVIGGERLPILPRRLIRALRTGRRAHAARRQNEALASPTAAQAYEEFGAYFEYGNWLGELLMPFPRLTRWALGWVA